MLTISPDLIILGLIAGVILFKLYSVLGRKDDDGKMMMPTKNSIFKEAIDISSIVKTEEVIDLATLEKDLAPGFEETIAKIRKIEPNFSLQKFLDGAKNAFEMILTAFAGNDRELLKNLLNEVIYKQFTREIDQRIRNKVSLHLSLVALPITEIKDIQLRNNILTIDMLFGSQQITLLKNDKGEIIEGDPSQIDHVEDLWTFSKELNGQQNWLLVKVNAS